MDVIILVSGNADKPLGAHAIQDATYYFSDHHIICDEPLWLKEGVALEIGISPYCNEEHLRALQNIFSTQKIDAFGAFSWCRRKKLLLADMDATIVAGETLDELAAKIGIGEATAAITARAMRGELDFKTALLERVSNLKGTPEAILSETLSHTVINDGAQDVVRVMRSHGAQCYLVSGGFTYFTGAISLQCGFDGHHGNVLGIQDGFLTGQVEGEILDKNAKLAFLEQYRETLELEWSDTMTVGDGANDIPMLQAAGLGVGFHPKPLVQESIVNNIIHTDLTSLLYIQGYSWQDIVSLR